jgi:hypothetical protein
MVTAGQVTVALSQVHDNGSVETPAVMALSLPTSTDTVPCSPEHVPVSVKAVPDPMAAGGVKVTEGAGAA